MNATTHKLENFVGLSYDELISSKIYDYEFTAEYEQSTDMQPGVVMAQNPQEGTKVLSGSKVVLTVSASADDISIPNVYSYTESQAMQALEKANLINVKFLKVSSENIEEGKVIYTDPKANTVVSSEDEIVVYISSGPSTTVIKSIKLANVQGLSQDGARAFLEKQGFTNISFITQDSGYPKNVVISQSPAAGETIEENTAIKLVISSGTPESTTGKQVKVSVAVKLPKRINADGSYASDTIKVQVDGSTYLNQSVRLDGSNKVISVNGDGQNSQSISVALTKIGAKETKITNGKNDQNFSIDFSGFSRNSATTKATTHAPTTTTTTTKAPEPTTVPSTNDPDFEPVDNSSESND
jgi:serine/threonine-protein kinase